LCFFPLSPVMMIGRPPGVQLFRPKISPPSPPLQDFFPSWRGDGDFFFLFSVLGIPPFSYTILSDCLFPRLIVGPPSFTHPASFSLGEDRGTFCLARRLFGTSSAASPSSDQRSRSLSASAFSLLPPVSPPFFLFKRELLELFFPPNGGLFFFLI